MKSLNRLITRAIRSPFPSRFPSTMRIDTYPLQVGIPAVMGS